MGMYSEIWGDVHSQCQPSLKATGGAWLQILRIVSGLKRMELEAVLLCICCSCCIGSNKTMLP